MSIPTLFLGKTDSTEAMKAARNAGVSSSTFFTICKANNARAVGMVVGRLEGRTVGCREGRVVGCDVGLVGCELG